MVAGESTGLNTGKVIKAVRASQRSAPGDRLPAHVAYLKNTQGNQKGNGRIKG